jgi:hypothetical protein
VNAPAKIRRAYPRKVEIVRAIEAGRACGLDVGGYEVSPDGTIRILERGAFKSPADEFERMEAAGLI